jgi:DNA-binding PadR family transcriptional regulator
MRYDIQNRAPARSHEQGPGEDGHHRRRHHPEGPGPRGARRTGARPERGGGRGRAQRGDIRAATLLLLAEDAMHGYQLMQAIAERTQGAWRPSPGAIYPTIAQLEDEGLVTVTPDAGRKLVALTDAGRGYLAEHRATIGDPFTAITKHGGGHNDLRGSVEQIHVAARAVGMGGTSEQIAAAQEILAQARRSLYLILAQDGPQPEPAGPAA